MEQLKGASLVLALALLANITRGWKGLLVKNGLAYYEISQITAVKSFITLAPEGHGQFTSILCLLWHHSKSKQIVSLDQCYKTFYGRYLRMFAISCSVSLSQAFQTWSKICG